jgi:hypothetical protein
MTTPATIALVTKAKKSTDMCLTKGLELQGYFLNNALSFTPELDTHNLQATRPSIQSIPATTPTDVSFTNVIGTAPTEFDIGGGINYTATVTGLYNLNAAVTWGTGVVLTRTLSIFVNGAAAVSSVQNAASGLLQSVSITTRVVAGQIIKVQVVNLNGTAQDINPSSFNVTLIRRTI